MAMTPQTGIKSFSSFSILIIFLLLTIIGICIIPVLSVQLFPSCTYASVTVQAQFPGASVEVTESSLTSPIESALSRLRGISKVSSSTEAGHATVRLELDKYTDPEIFRFEAATLLRQLYPQLPQQANFPSIHLNQPDESSGEQAILTYVLHGPGSKAEITAVAEQRIRPAMADIAGIHEFDIVGDQPSELAIYTDPRRMRTAGITMEDLQGELRKILQNRDLGTGRFVDGKYALFLQRTVDAADELGQVAVSNRDGRMFRLEDLAVVTTAQPIARSYYRINGQDLINMTFWSEENVNTIRLAASIKQKIEKLVPSLPAGYAIELQFDSTTHIKEELSKIYLRISLSVGILLLFVTLITRNLRYIIIVVSALIANVSLSFILYYLFRIDIHLYSLAGITVALGLVIDNVIVIVEDIRHTGRNRIFAAILASTLTAFGALSVVFFLEDSQRLNLIDFALAIMMNLLVSLPIAYFLIPALLDQFPVRIKRAKVRYRRKRGLVRFASFYRRQIRFMLRFRWGFALLFILSFGLPLFLLPQKLENQDSTWSKWYNASLGSEFYNKHLREPLNKYLGGVLYFYIANKGANPAFRFGADDADAQTRIQVSITMPNGATLAQMDEVCREMERIVMAYQRDIELFTTRVGGGTSAQIQVLFNRNASQGAAYRLKGVLERNAVLSGAADFAIYGVGRGFNNTIHMDRFDSAIQLKGYNYQQLQEIALVVRDSLLTYKRVSDVLISSERKWGQRSSFEHVVRFTDPAHLSLRQVARWNISRALTEEAAATGFIGQLPDLEGNLSDVNVYHQREQVPDVWSTMQLPLQVNDSVSIRLAGITDRDKVRVGERVVREGQEYVLYINYRFIGTYQLNQTVSNRVMKAITPALPYGYTVQPERYSWGEESEFNYLWFIPLVIGIIYMICAVLLESLIQPIAVILMIPCSFIGVFLTFHLLGLQFDQGGYAALLMLSGIVTNAALYIINDYNYFGRLRHSTPPIDRYIQAFNAKAMPILVTTIAALLSLLPFMITGEEKGFWFTLSAGTIGGLIFSLIGVYLVLPLCMLAKDRRKCIKGA